MSEPAFDDLVAGIAGQDHRGQYTHVRNRPFASL
jgi:hypothetical protein